MTSYFLRADYQTNPVTTMHSADGVDYWSAKRISRARIYQYDVYKWAAELVRTRNIRSVADVGCGPAVKLNQLLVPIVPRCVGIDQPSAIEYCRSHYKEGEYIVDDFENPVNTPEGGFDLTICCDVIEHVENPDLVLNYLFKVGGENGLFLISTPARERLRGPHCTVSPNPAHVREWASDEFQAYLESRGLTVLERRYLPPLTAWPPGLVFVRHLLRQLKPDRKWRFNMAVLCTKAG
jgi:SAM-dependent methyltransferase